MVLSGSRVSGADLRAMSPEGLLKMIQDLGVKKKKNDDEYG